MHPGVCLEPNTTRLVCLTLTGHSDDRKLKAGNSKGPGPKLTYLIALRHFWCDVWQFYWPFSCLSKSAEFSAQYRCSVPLLCVNSFSSLGFIPLSRIMASSGKMKLCNIACSYHERSCCYYFKVSEFKIDLHVVEPDCLPILFNTTNSFLRRQFPSGCYAMQLRSQGEAESTSETQVNFYETTWREHPRRKSSLYSPLWELEILTPSLENQNERNPT